ncbi:ATP-binding cassette sub-family G member 1 [Cryptotermes secundus]|uniref:ATP-binding cassette sub-family G member 1 n=1 Tax=Cryptotermes secundus TaxID=105785 RepID=A0A2J7RCU0_9NEOP|nr:ATP-binding cassette sub-family G member 1 [Cryptotermes secundus]PNF38654.1 ATP-binding cassette sub-family G member 1 [Cryptotermes secundus]
MLEQSDSAAVQPHVFFRQATTPTQSTVVTYKSGGNGCVKITGNGYQQTFSRLPRRTPVDIQFENIGFTASLGFRKGRKKILHELNGRFAPRQLIAIMGPSGAGKSTLLDVLSGYRITGVTGSVILDGEERNMDAFRRLSCYITQDDRLQPLLTVRENMQIAADLKLQGDVSRREKNNIIEEILSTLRLSEHGNTRTGRLSGGQRKRLSIALELITNPLIFFLDEPTTGLDSSSCTQCVSLLRLLARQGRTIICTIHQPSASLFQMFDHVYVLSQGRCLYQGAAGQLVSYLAQLELPCPKYHNPADYVIELACGEYGQEKIDRMVEGTDNGRSETWFQLPEEVKDIRTAVEPMSGPKPSKKSSRHGLQETSSWNQLKALLRRGYIKTKRDQTLTHLRILVNIIVAIMLGILFLGEGNEGSRVLDNYNLLFACLIHNMMTPMMITILTFPSEMSVLQKEHFNRWYSLKSYYISITITDIPVMVLGSFLFTLLVYFISGQPSDMGRFNMFFVISLLIVYVAMSFGLMIGAVFDVVNGTFLGPAISVPVMMFAGFGVNLRDMPSYLKWGSHISYLRYGLEGYISAIYGYGREVLDCVEFYCHYRFPNTFLHDIAMTGDQFWNDVIALSVTLLLLRVVTYCLLRWKLHAMR